jgi:probable phosphoglycerate mutase
VPLTDLGIAQAQLLGLQLRELPIDLCVHTRFPRTRQTAALALEGRDVPFREEPLLDDVNVGDLDGLPIADYRAVKRRVGRTEPFPGGESLSDAAHRYARAFRALAREEGTVLVVCHEIPVRYAVNASSAAVVLDRPVHDVPNATPFLFSPEALARAADCIDQLAAAEA